MQDGVIEPPHHAHPAADWCGTVHIRISFVFGDGFARVKPRTSHERDDVTNTDAERIRRMQ
jgi:hypothetical protein